MKLLLLTFLVLSFNAQADQADILAKQRDHFLENSMSLLKKYCPHSAEYVCRQQLEIDCDHGAETKKKNACETLTKVKQLEKLVLSADKNLAGIAHIDLPYEKPPVEEKPVVVPVPEPVKVVQGPAYRNVAVRLGSNFKEGRKNGAPNEDIKAIVDLQEKIAATKYRIDCDSDADCHHQGYGKKICGGPIGYFTYSTKGGESASLVSDVVKINALDESFISKWDKYAISTCDSTGPTEKPVCGVNGCQ